MSERSTFSMLQLLQDRACNAPHDTAFSFYNTSCISYGHLWRRIEEIAHALVGMGLGHQETVPLLIPNSPDFFFAFYGIQRAGGVAVPLYPRSGIEMVLRLTRLCRSKVILYSRHLPNGPREDLLVQQHGAGSRFLALEDLERMPPAPNKCPLPTVHAEDLAMIQFTSGSTADPRGVLLTHHNLTTNIGQMIRGLDIRSRDRFVSWLPVYHDMGLILMTMVPLNLGCSLTLLPTGLRYLQTWLQIMSESRASFTAAPDFAYRLCIKLVRRDKAIDLSSLRVALNAAEPVRRTTISAFESRFGLNRVLLPAYGLAEATVGVCSGIPGQASPVDSRGFVSVGRPFPGVEMKVVRRGRSLPDGEIGEIMVKSEANCLGYIRNHRASRKLFDSDFFMYTGDLGYRDAEGNHYITGRKKNTIIIGGRNIAAREVEEVVDQLPFVHRSAALGLDLGGALGEQLHVFIELSTRADAGAGSHSELIFWLVSELEAQLDLHPGQVILLRHGAIPLTHNGKTRYGKLKMDFQEGNLAGKTLFAT